MLLATAIFLVFSVGGLALVTALVIRLPADYFSEHYDRRLWPRAHPVLRWSALIGKNIVGFGLVVLGVVLSMPGIPGPGFLTILLGIMLMDFPGKRRLECWLIQRPSILSTVNGLRQRYGRAPFNVDPAV